VSQVYRQKVVRADGKAITIAQRRAHLSYCFNGCCCGRTERGYAAVPVDTYKEEWLGRKLRNVVHLTKAGCLGPCALANVASLVFDTRSVWFHSVNSAWQVRLIFDYIESMIQADRYLQPPAELAEYVFNYYDWDTRPNEPRPARTAAGETAIEGIALLSHADTDILTLQRARQELPVELPVTGISLHSVRSEEQMSMMLEGTLGRRRILVLRVHGPTRTIAGFSVLTEHCSHEKVHLVIVSGTGEIDPELVQAGNVPLDVVESVTAYLGLSGSRNMAECLKYLSDRLALTGHGYDPPATMPEHGIYISDIESPGFEDWERRADPGRPTVAILFYRAHVLSGNTTFVDVISEALDAKGLNPLCVFTSSLKAMENGTPAVLKLIEGRADVLVSTLSFALGEVNTGSVTLAGDNVSALAALGIPVIQAITAGTPRGAWEVSRRGLSALDTAINVAIPEFDGRIITVPISFKERVQDNPATLYLPDEERIERVAGIASRLARLRHCSNSEKRVAFV